MKRTAALTQEEILDPSNPKAQLPLSQQLDPNVELIPIPPKEEIGQRRYTRRDKIADSEDFNDYWRQTSNKGVVTHTIQLTKPYEENLYKLVTGNVISFEYKSDSDMFEWLLSKAFERIMEELKP